MADASLWQLVALTSPTTDDLLLAVDAPGGAAATKKLAISDFIANLAVSNVVVQTKTVGSGTYTPTAGMKKVLAIGVGGGGAGGSGTNTDSTGGGGGGGATCIRLLTAAQIGVSKAYVVGSATVATTLDAAGALLNAGGGSNASDGATTTTIGVQTAGGAGGTATNGDLNIPGRPGDRGVTFSTSDGWGGRGGSSTFGFGGLPGGSDVTGGPGTAYGGAGAGGHAAGSPNRLGGAGADGILYLIEFL